MFIILVFPCSLMKCALFSRDTLTVAKGLLGMVLTHDGVSGKIVETEAYLHDDPASHSFNGMTKRNAQMFGSQGTAYVYFTYGMHFCFNVVTNKDGVGEAVLIRALEPMSGIKAMKKRRKKENIHELCNGPAKLVQAMGITKQHNGADLLSPSSPLQIICPKTKESFSIVKTKRIGITKGNHLFHRFYVKGNTFVSRTSR